MTIRGQVQGVGFRWFAQDVANAHDVTGWVRNVGDGAVEAQLHGSDSDVAAATDALSRGPAGARVDEVTTEDVPVTRYTGFEIRATE